MNDIRPPRSFKVPPTPPPKPKKPVAEAIPLDHRLEEPPVELLLEAHTPIVIKRSWRKWLFRSFLGLIVVGVLSLIGGYIWYQQQLASVSSDLNAARVSIVIDPGTAPSQIGNLLLEKHLIRNKLAFTIYTRLSGNQNKLQAGAYKLSPAEPLPTIIDHLVKGRIETFDITFYPGGTLRDTTDKPENRKQDATTILKHAGYSEQAIQAALNKQYTGALFSGKPATASLEGYIYGQTYRFQEGTSVEDILRRTFDEFSTVVETNQLVEKYKKQGLSLYQGITLASIVEREVHAAGDRRQVAQVFLKRYRDGGTLGSDITAYYGADQIGAARAVTVDTPYNTRIHAGLPPGPIASPGLSSLLAIADPAPGDYTYFLSGDDGKTYFAHTNEEHEANIREHCAQKCAID